MPPPGRGLHRQPLSVFFHFGTPERPLFHSPQCFFSLQMLHKPLPMCVFPLICFCPRSPLCFPSPSAHWSPFFRPPRRFPSIGELTRAPPKTARARIHVHRNHLVPVRHQSLLLGLIRCQFDHTLLTRTKSLAKGIGRSGNFESPPWQTDQLHRQNPAHRGARKENNMPVQKPPLGIPRPWAVNHSPLLFFSFA